MTLNPENIELHPDSKRQIEELELLKENLMSLYVKRDFLIYHKKYNLENEFYRTLGALIVESAQLELDYKKIKYTCELIQSDLNRNIIPSIEYIEQIVDKELNEWELKLLETKSRLLNSIVCMGKELSAEETKEMKACYYDLVKILHPDVCDIFDEKNKLLWDNIQKAYKNADLNAIKSYHILIKDIDIKANSDWNDSNKIVNIKNQISKISREIEELKTIYPFNLEEKLNDDNWIKEERKRLKNHIEEYKKLIEDTFFRLNKMKIIINGQYNQN